MNVASAGEVPLGVVYRALANDTRRLILDLLREPHTHFDDNQYRGLGLSIEDGVCVQDIQKATKISQSVASTYLKSLQSAGFLTSYREGRWTYYRRDEDAIRAIADRIGQSL